ncbi:hypothetical protein NX059_003846 [Plenodomus lindquistii]|nr:hypothetical protein NX059_003846 [Plenodomus lindquistii]
MHFYSLTSLSLLLGCVAGAVAQAGTTKTNYETKCVTKMATKSIKNVPTLRSTTSKTLPAYTLTETAHSTVTITPFAKTIVVTRTSNVLTTTTLDAITTPYTTTLTSTDTVTTVEVQTSTAIETSSTTVTETVSDLIPTPAGFRPIADTTARPAGQRRWEDFNDVVKRTARKQASKKDGCDATQYAESVQCTVKVIFQPIRKIKVQGRPITKLALKPFVFKTTTLVSTSTSTQLPATVTSTATESTLVSVTQVSLSTTTVTSTLVETATATTTLTGYAACQTSNALSTYNGRTVNNVYNNVGAGSTFTNTVAASAEACCGLCQQAISGPQGCQGYAYMNGRCVMLYSREGICDVSRASGYFSALGGAAYTIGNGPCGFFYAGP